MKKIEELQAYLKEVCKLMEAPCSDLQYRAYADIASRITKELLDLDAANNKKWGDAWLCLRC